MNITTAIDLLNAVQYKPGWTFTFTDATNRFENAVRVHINYEAPDTDVVFAPDYTHMIPGGARADFLMVVDCDDPIELYRRLFNIIMTVEYHESREFFSVEGSVFRKPFHPHTIEGMRTWAAGQDRSPDKDPFVFADLMFGAA